MHNIYQLWDGFWLLLNKPAKNAIQELNVFFKCIYLSIFQCKTNSLGH